jgi:glycerophosphoryl diester phosphodiesterase
MKKQPRELICFAHRGASGHEPENTLLAIEKALSLGAPWIEIDVFCVEGELVVIHDERLEYTTNGRGYVTEKTLAHLRTLDAGKGQRIPLLREVFDLVERRAGINVELKGAGTAVPTVKLVRDYIMNRSWRYDQVLLSSFDHRELSRVKPLDPDIRTGALILGIPRRYAEFAEELQAFSVHAGFAFANRAFVEDTHRRGLKFFVYTVNLPDDLDRVRTMGADGVFTNFPELVIHRKT